MFLVTFKGFTQGQNDMHIGHGQIQGGGGEEVRNSHPGKSQVSIENSNWTSPWEFGTPWKILGLDPIPSGEISWIHACRHVADKQARVCTCTCFMYVQILCAVFGYYTCKSSYVHFLPTMVKIIKE